MAVRETVRKSESGSTPAAAYPGFRSRVERRGKFLFAGESKLYVRGVAYGTFRPNEEGVLFPAREAVERDFAAMAAHGINTIRTYTVPPRWLLDLAERHGLFVIVGIPWEQHVAFLHSRRRARSIEQRVRAGVRECGGHPAVLAYAIGNEIPSSIVRWHGRRAIERFLERLYWAAKHEDPEALVTYVNYPSTEYLQLPFLDFVCFNVFLEAEEHLDAYLARLQNISGDRPLLVTELGLDSCRHGEDGQAVSLGWQIRTAFRAGCAGCVVFSWTDEWQRNGVDIDDWRFGLTDLKRRPKPALAAVQDAFGGVPFPAEVDWPRVSVVVCSHNGASTLGNCLEGLARLEYPEYEVLLVDDGSSDDTAEIGEAFGVRVIRTEHSGLSAARNAGLREATGEIVAYLDDDCRPDPQWLTYLAATFMVTPHAGVGGPNVPPGDNRAIARCVASAPGGPIHVLVSDREAEHIPGCNMAFRRDVLLEIGGFDPQFWVAGDDVDVCWRLQQRGWTLGFSPGAMVWHQRRNSLRSYFRQQRGYGRAEALLERKWPAKYNRGGHLRWRGRVYSNGHNGTPRRARIYYGTWGSGLFQSVYQRAPGTLTSLPLMPEWYLLLGFLAAVSAYELTVGPILFDLPVAPLLLALSSAIVVIQAGVSAFRSYPRDLGPRRSRLWRGALTGVLFLLQPLARLSGRLELGLTPWRNVNAQLFVTPRPRTVTVWCESWRSAEERLVGIESALGRLKGVAVSRGGEFNRWEIQARTGALGTARLRLAVEEHGDGRQLLRFRLWPRVSSGAMIAVGALVVALAFGARGAGAQAILGASALAICVRVVRDCAAGLAVLVRAVAADREQSPGDDELGDALKLRARSAAEPSLPRMGMTSFAVAGQEAEDPRLQAAFNPAQEVEP
jgi:GT2 family glycosyltransferase